MNFRLRDFGEVWKERKVTATQNECPIASIFEKYISPDKINHYVPRNKYLVIFKRLIGDIMSQKAFEMSKIVNMNERDREFEEYLKKIEDLKNEKEINRALPKNPTPLQVAKYKLCKKVLAYQIKNNLTDEELIKRLDLSQAEVEDVLFCEIERFTLDRLLTYASRLLPPEEIEVSTTREMNITNA